MRRKDTEQKPKKREKNRDKKVLVSANDDMQQPKTSRADNQKSMKDKAGLSTKGHEGGNRTQSQKIDQREQARPPSQTEIDLRQHSLK